MPLSPGLRLGPYEILAPIGAGGMGEVYRAKDPRLGRDVAIKVLPSFYSADPDRLRRFEQEARAAGILNHPNITAVHDIGSHEGAPYVVSELLEGDTPRLALSGGKLSQRKAIDYALQIAHGLAAAHAKGIVHRDLKPENLFVLNDGRVKILDFGLAKLTHTEAGPEVTSLSTATGGTEPGVVLGTLGYMSPEQVKGKPADSRSDIFSFGAILYEMLSGQRAFHGDSAAETMSAILREEPSDLSGSDRHVDPALEGLVRHCLEKSPEERFQSARDLAYALSTLSSSSGAASGATGRIRADRGGRRRRQLAILGSVAAGVLLGGLAAGVLLRPRPAEPPSFQVLTYSGDDTQPSVSPDGKTIAFTSLRGGRSRIWIKQLAGGGEAALTEGPDTFPRFSPDGSAVLFVRQVKDTRVTVVPGPSMIAESVALYRVPLVGGEVRKIVGQATEGDWSPDGREIGFLRVDLKEGKIESSVHRIAVDGTNERMVARVADRVLLRLCWSPDGLTLAAIEVQGAGTGRPRIVFFPLDGKAPRHLEAPESGRVLGFTWNGDGRHLIFLGGGSETGFGSRTIRVFLQGTRTGKARAILSGIDLRGAVEVLGPGSLLLVTGGRRSNLREVSLTKPGEAGRWLTRGSSVDRQPIYAPDGEWVAFTSNRSGNNDIWEVSTKSGAVRRLTDDPAEDFDPAFTSDGKHLFFSSNRSGHFEIWIAERDGNGARRVSGDGVDAENPTATPDGQWIVYTSHNPEKRGVWKVRADGSAASRLVAGAGTVALAEISPDGRFVSYATQGGMIRVVRFEDGAPVPFEVTSPGSMLLRGRHRWMPGGGALVFPEKGDLGIAAQDFTPGRDTSATRRLLTGFTPDSLTESLGVAPDGTRLTVSELLDSASLLLAEGVDGVVARMAQSAKRP